MKLGAGGTGRRVGATQHAGTCCVYTPTTRRGSFSPLISPSLKHEARLPAMRSLNSDSDRVPTVEVAAMTPDIEDTLHFLEPAVRSFALGAAAGVLLELLHVLTQFTSFATTAGESLPTLLPEVVGHLTPLVAWDNLMAVTSCALFYGLEVLAILPVLKAHPDDSKQAAQLITSLPTLPKRLMPVKLVNVKRAIYKLIAMRNPTAALANASAFTGVSAPARPAPFLDSPRGSAGTSVLDRPRAPTAPPPIGAPGGPLPPLPPGLLDEVKPGSATKPAAPRTRPTWNKGTAGPRALPPPEKVAPVPRGPLAPGAWNPQEALPTSRRARELRDQRAYLKNFWYAAALSQNIKKEPHEVKLLGRTVVMFRDETGVVRCLDNVCPHRGAPLSKGWTKSVDGHTCVVCPYHGWAFAGDGKVLDVPSSADQSRLPKRPLVDAYPVQEQEGFVWLFFGSSDMPADERPPIPSCPELSNPAWQPVYGEIEFDAPHWSVFDNALDMAHIHYLHGDSFGNSNKPVIMDMNMNRGTWDIEGSFRIHNKPVNPLWEFTAVESVPVQYRAMLPSTSSIKIKLGAGVEMITFVNTVPIDANRAINRFCLIRNFAGWEGFDLWARNAMFKILGEDKVMVEQLSPSRMRAEVSLEADLPQIAFRKLRKDWVAMGYSVDPELTEAPTGTLDM